jgi:heterodisulfide reductase subunit A-like polyferredoxin
MNEKLMHYEINESGCIGCSYCKLKCKFNSIRPDHSNIMSIESLTCTKCGLCMNVCPVNAIHIIRDINEKQL